MQIKLISLGTLVAAVSAVPGTTARAQEGADRSDVTLSRDLHRGSETPEATPSIRSDLAVPIGAEIKSTGPVFVGAVTISGLRAMAPADFADILTLSIGKNHSALELAALASAITERMHGRGFKFGSAWIERQRLANGVVVVRVDEGRVDEIRFEGAEIPAVRRALDPLRTGRPVQMAEVERRLLIAGDVDGIRILGSRFLREGERGVLLVKAAKDHAALRISLSNAGTRPTGPEQVRIDVNFNGLLASDDSLTLSYTATPAQPRELQFGFLRYEKRVGAAGTEVALVGSWSSSQPGAYLTSLGLQNRSWYLGTTVLQPLLRRRKSSLWIEGELGFRSVVQWRGSNRTRDDRLSVGRVTLYGYSDLAGGRLRFSGTLSQGFEVLGATPGGYPKASRWDADATFTAGSLWADWSRDLGGGLSVRLAGQGQLSSQPLLISEELSLGGTAFLRGYDWGERSGDEGLMGSLELRYLWNSPLGLAKRAQVYAFFDGGTVSNKGSTLGSDALASAGGGVRMDMTSKLGANFEVGVPLSGIRYDTGTEAPRFRFGLTSAF